MVLSKRLLMYIHDLIRIPAYSNSSAAEYQIKGNKRIYAESLSNYFHYSLVISNESIIVWAVCK